MDSDGADKHYVDSDVAHILDVGSDGADIPYVEALNACLV